MIFIVTALGFFLLRFLFRIAAANASALNAGLPDQEIS
jgi:hypothetical protein